MTPVIVLSDSYLANSAEPWRIPDVDDAAAPRRSRSAPSPNGFMPVPARPRDARASLGDPGHAGPRAPHRRPREAGRHGQRLVPAREPPAHDRPARARRSRGIAQDDRRPSRSYGADARQAAGGRLGRHARRDHLGGRRGARRGTRRRERAPAPPESVRRRTSARCCAASSACWSPELNTGQLCAAAARRVPGAAPRASPRCRASRSRSPRSAARIERDAGSRVSEPSRSRSSPARTSSRTRTCAGARAAATTRSSPTCSA